MSKSRLFFSTLGFACVFALSSAAAAPMHLWSRHFGNYSIDLADDIAANPASGFVIAGGVATLVDFGGGFLVPVQGASLFLAKYDHDCNHQWSKLFDEAANTQIALDGQGNTVVVGDCFSDIDFGGGTLPGLAGTFAARLGPSGAHIWSRRYPRGVNADGVAVDELGNTYVAGGMGGTYSFGGPPLTSAGLGDVFIVKYDANGTHVWSKRYGSSSSESGTRIALDSTGNLFVSGSCDGTVDFGGGPLMGPAGVFLFKVDPNGNHQWSRRFGGPNNDQVEDVAVDVSGNVLIAGWYSGTAVYGGAALTPVGGNDVFLAKFANDGTHQWSQSMGGPGASDRALGLAVDPSGNAIITGDFEPGAQFGGGVLPNAGGTDIFVARYDQVGAHNWSISFGSAEFEERGEAVAADGQGNIIAYGIYANAVDFGGGPLQSYGFHDVFVAKFGELPVPVLISDFSARARGNVVDVAWDFSTDEAVDAVTLYRTGEDDTRAVTVASGDATWRSFTDATVVAGRRYRYELAISTADGDLVRSPAVAVNMPEFANALDQNHPNPFNPSTTITYTLAKRAATAVAIYDARGALVARLDAGEHEAGTHSVSWDGRDAAGMAVASGVYFYQLEGVRDVAQRRMVLLK